MPLYASCFSAVIVFDTKPHLLPIYLDRFLYNSGLGGSTITDKGESNGRANWIQHKRKRVLWIDLSSIAVFFMFGGFRLSTPYSVYASVISCP